MEAGEDEDAGHHGAASHELPPSHGVGAQPPGRGDRAAPVDGGGRDGDGNERQPGGRDQRHSGKQELKRPEQHEVAGQEAREEPDGERPLRRSAHGTDEHGAQDGCRGQVDDREQRGDDPEAMLGERVVVGARPAGDIDLANLVQAGGAGVDLMLCDQRDARQGRDHRDSHQAGDQHDPGEPARGGPPIRLALRRLGARGRCGNRRVHPATERLSPRWSNRQSRPGKPAVTTDRRCCDQAPGRTCRIGRGLFPRVRPSCVSLAPRASTRRFSAGDGSKVPWDMHHQRARRVPAHKAAPPNDGRGERHVSVPAGPSGEARRDVGTHTAQGTLRRAANNIA